MAHRAVISIVLCFYLVVPSSAIAARCTACQAVARELQRRLDAETPRNHLDMRHRLDSKGQRYGKVIDYRVSELRVLELVEDLCKDTMDDYMLGSVDKNATEADWRWIKVSGDGGVKLAAAQQPPSGARKQYQRHLMSFCGQLLEDYEDEVSDAITSGRIHATTVEALLCQRLAMVCTGSESPSATDTDGGSATVSEKSEL